MKKSKMPPKYCIFCREQEALREMKSCYVCEKCVGEIKKQYAEGVKNSG